MNQKNLSGKILAAPIAIISLVILIAVGGYLGYLIYQSKQIEEVETSTTVSEPSDTSDQSEPSGTSNSSTTSDSFDESTETADWKEFKNERFLFKYPESWEIKTFENIDPTLALDNERYKIYKIKFTTDDKKSFSLEVPYPETGYEGWEFEPPKEIISIGKVIFEREIGKTIPEMHGGKIFFSYHAISQEPGKQASLYGIDKDIPDTLINNLDQLLATFKFTD